MNKQLLKIENQLCFPLYAAARLVTRLYQPILAELEITYPQYLVFLLLWDKDNRAVSELCNCLFLDSNTMTPLLQRLEAKQLISRKRDSVDERKVIVSLTKTGKLLKKKASKIPQYFKSELTANATLSAAELHDLHRLLNRLIVTAAEA